VAIGIFQQGQTCDYVPLIAPTRTDQMKAAMQKSGSVLVVFKDFAKNRQSQMKKIVDAEDGAKGPLQIASGFGDMAIFLGEFLVEGCHK